MWFLGLCFGAAVLCLVVSGSFRNKCGVRCSEEDQDKAKAAYQCDLRPSYKHRHFSKQFLVEMMFPRVIKRRGTYPIARNRVVAAYSVFLVAATREKAT